MSCAGGAFSGNNAAQNFSIKLEIPKKTVSTRYLTHLEVSKCKGGHLAWIWQLKVTKNQRINLYEEK